MTSGKAAGGLAVAGRQLSPRPSGESPAARRAAAHSFPVTAAACPRRNVPMPRYTSRTRPSRSHQVCRSPYKVTVTGPERRAIVRVGPSSVKGTRRSFLTASQKRSSGPTLEHRRYLCRPSGPDGEGQARGQARSARRTSVGRQLSADETKLKCNTPRVSIAG
jgi:hypothetical protein